MNKIGIMTYYAVHNYGAALQAFALQKNVERFGVKSEFLRFYDKHNEKSEKAKGSLMASFLNNSQVRNNILYHLPRYIRLKRFTKPNALAFEKFKKDYLRSSIEPYYDSEDLRLANNRYNGFICGSDMVWTPIGQNLEAYFLQFADKEKRFSYAASMTGCKTYSKENANKIKKYLNGMNIISCREQEGIDYVKAITGLNATLAIDPTLLFSKEEWREELNITLQNSSKPYILCYNFGGLKKSIKREVYRIAKERNMDVRYIPLSHEESDEELKLAHKGPYGPREFVELFFNASFIVTNTFHGFIFSLISENPFVVVRRENENAWKVNETRISNLMDMIDISERYIELDAKIDDKFWNLDYGKINEIINIKRQESLAYLKRVVETACKNEFGNDEYLISNVRDLSIKQCTGCNLCSVVCPFGAIKMKENEEGFVVPNVCDNKCKECGKCAKMCPSVHPLETNFPIATKLCVSKDKLVDKSASGGVFISIARYFIEQLNGVVFGVVLDDKYSCKHTEATTIEELAPMQNSKYIQSNVEDIYRRVKYRLESGRSVLFTGTPCQVASLKSYLSEKYDNLLTLEVVCHGVPNQKFWKRYIFEESKKREITDYTFRTRGNRLIAKTTLEATVSYGVIKEQKPWCKSVYYGAFIRNESFRMSCYYCQYARKERIADITMGDCDSVNNYPSFHPNEAKSIAILNTQKGIKIWDKLNEMFHSTELDYNKEVDANIPLGQPTPMPSARHFFYANLEQMTWADFCMNYIHTESIVDKIKKNIAKILHI